MLRFSELAGVTPGKELACHRDRFINVLALDSRKAALSDEVLFFAIKGERHDGHDHIADLYHKGVRQFVAEEILPVFAELHEANIYLVPSSVKALQDVARYHRNKFSIPVLGITGSNGKTIIKEWLFQLLSKTQVVVKNPGSYNSQVGVPLSVWQIQSHHTFGIFEAGISRPEEMEKLREVIQPSFGLFTNIGPAHSEGFPTMESKVSEKLKLFRDVKWLVYCSDHAEVAHAIQEAGIPAISWGKSDSADIMVSRVGLDYQIRSGQTQFMVRLPFDDKASVENCLHVVTIMLKLGYSPSVIQEGISGLKAIPMRLELKEGINQCYIIDDTYNNDLAGIQISLQFLIHQKQRKEKAVILSDVLESGLAAPTLARQIAALIKQEGISTFIGVGPVLRSYSELFPSGSRFYLDTEDFLTHHDLSRFHDQVILIKGARAFQFERIVNRLQRKVHGTVMEIDLGALVHNFNLIKARLASRTKVMVMVKAFAYGSGSNEIANLLQYHQADYLGVAYADEGIELRKSNISLPIMVMNPSAASFEQMFSYRLEPEIYSLKILHDLVRTLGSRECKIHVKIDTGMHRLGFEESMLDQLVELLKAHPNIHVASIFSHLAGADEVGHDDFSREQVQLFLRSAEKITTALGYHPLLHVLNSPGILRLPQYQLDMVRLGIGLYGVNPTGVNIDFRPVATLKTIISQIKHVSAGETIGYGRRGQVPTDLTVATIAIGYADGFSRAFSRGRGKVLVNGQLAPVIGNVCMDMAMIDITGINAAEGDEVVIFGRDLPIQNVAEWIETIPYEILTNTSERVKRVFTAESL